MRILYCIDCDEVIEVYNDGSNYDRIISFFIEHKCHDIRDKDF